MSTAMISVIGLYQHDSLLFADAPLPVGVDRETLIDTILLRCGELEPLYADGLFFKSAVNSFFRKWYYTFDKWQRATEIEYNPLDNYDRHEEYTDVKKSAENGKFASKSTTVDDGTNENKKSAYDADTYQPYEQDKIDNTQTIDGSGNNSTDRDETIKHTAHLYGNIGVTTSQQMLQSEYDIAAWNIYEHIADIFMTELTLCIY